MTYQSCEYNRLPSCCPCQYEAKLDNLFVDVISGQNISLSANFLSLTKMYRCNGPNLSLIDFPSGDIVYTNLLVNLNRKANFAITFSFDIVIVLSKGRVSSGYATISYKELKNINNFYNKVYPLEVSCDGTYLKQRICVSVTGSSLNNQGSVQLYPEIILTSENSSEVAFKELLLSNFIITASEC